MIGKERVRRTAREVSGRGALGAADLELEIEDLEEAHFLLEIGARQRVLIEPARGQVEAQRLIEATDAALAADGELLDDDERAQLDTLLAALRTLAQSDDGDAVEAATKAVAEGTDEFAARRMNKGIRRALAGRKLDEI